MLQQVSGIDTVNEIFRATVDLEMHYIISHEDVVRFVVDPESWTPSPDLVPEVPQCTNPESADSVHISKQKPFLEIRDNAVWAVQKISYSGTFREILELNNFPFDIQWLHVKFEVQQQGCVMRQKTLMPGNRLEDLQEKWLNGGFTLLDVQ